MHLISTSKRSYFDVVSSLEPSHGIAHLFAHMIHQIWKNGSVLVITVELSGSHTDGSVTTAISNSFLSP